MLVVHDGNPIGHTTGKHMGLGNGSTVGARLEPRRQTSGLASRHTLPGRDSWTGEP
jgi:hypothetical protein